MARRRKPCRLREKTDNSTAPGLVLRSHGVERKRLLGKKEGSAVTTDCTMVPEITFDIAPEPTVVVDTNDTHTDGGSIRRSLRLRGRQVTRSGKKGGVADQECTLLVPSAEASPSKEQDCSTSRQLQVQTNAKVSVLVDLSNAQNDIQNHLSALRSRSRDAKCRDETMGVESGYKKKTQAESEDQGDELKERVPIADEASLEGDNRSQPQEGDAAGTTGTCSSPHQDDNDALIRHKMSSRPEEQSLDLPGDAIRKEVEAENAEQPSPSNRAIRQVNSAGNEEKVDVGGEQEEEEQCQEKDCNDGQVPTLSANETAGGDREDTLELSFESRRIREEVRKRIEDCSSSDDDLPGTKTTVGVTEKADVLFDTLLAYRADVASVESSANAPQPGGTGLSAAREPKVSAGSAVTASVGPGLETPDTRGAHNASSDIEPAVSSENEHRTSSGGQLKSSAEALVPEQSDHEVTAHNERRHEVAKLLNGDTGSNDNTLVGLSGELPSALVAPEFHTVAETELAALERDDDQVTKELASEESLTTRFNKFKKSSFKASLPPHVNLQKQSTVAKNAALPSSFTSDDAGTTDLQLVAGNATRLALTMLESRSHDNPSGPESRPDGEDICIDSCAEKTSSLDSDADIDVIMHSKCVGPSMLQSAFLDTEKRKSNKAARCNVGTSIGALVTDHATSNENEPSLDLFVEDEANQSAANARESPGASGRADLPNAPDSNEDGCVIDAQPGVNADRHAKTTAGRTYVQQSAEYLPQVQCNTAAPPPAESGRADIEPEHRSERGVGPADGDTYVVMACRTAVLPPREVYPEGELAYLFMDDLKEFRPSRKSKMESTRLGPVETVHREDSVIAENEFGGTAARRAAEDHAHRGSDDAGKATQSPIKTAAFRVNIAVATGPSLVETPSVRHGNPNELKHTSLQRASEDVAPETGQTDNVVEEMGRNSAAVLENVDGNELSGQKNISHRGQTQAAKPICDSEAHDIEMRAPAASDLLADCGDENHRPEVCESNQCDKVGEISESNRMADNSIRVAVQLEAVQVSSGSTNAPEADTEIHERSSGRSTPVEPRTVSSLQGSLGVEGHTVEDPFGDLGDRPLIELIPEGFVSMPFLGLHQTVESTGQGSVDSLAKDRSPVTRGKSPSPILLAATGSVPVSPRSLSRVGQYRVGKQKPFRLEETTPSSTNNPLGPNASGVRRRYLFRDVDDEQSGTLLPEIEAVGGHLTSAKRTRLECFVLDSRRLPQFHDSYVEVNLDQIEAKSRAERLLTAAVRSIMDANPSVKSHIQQALEDRILPKFEDRVKQLLALLVKRTALKMEVSRGSECFERQQSRLATIRHFITSTVDAVLPEHEIDAVKVLGFNPFDGQAPPSEAARSATIRRLRETSDTQ